MNFLDFERRRMSVVVDYEDNCVLPARAQSKKYILAAAVTRLIDEVYPLIDMIRARPIRRG